MHIVVPCKQVPDLAEELEINAEGTALDTTFMRYRLNEFDEHAVEQAVLLKEQHGGTVTVIALDRGDPDEALFTAIAKGADRAVKLGGDWEGAGSAAAAAVLAAAITDLKPDLVLTGVQAIDDLDGQMAPLLAQHLNLPWLSVVTGVSVSGGAVIARKEYAGGLLVEMEMDMPAVLGIQAAAQPPRYAAVSKVRQVMKTAKIETTDVALPAAAAPALRPQYKPEGGGRAQMLEGSAEEQAGKILQIMADRGLVRR